MDEETKDVARSGPGPRYDTTLRWLVANDPVAMCRLLGEEPTQPPWNTGAGSCGAIAA